MSTGLGVGIVPAREPTLRPAPAPAAKDCRAPKEAIGFTEELLLEVGEEPGQGDIYC